MPGIAFHQPLSKHSCKTLEKNESVYRVLFLKAFADRPGGVCEAPSARRTLRWQNIHRGPQDSTTSLKFAPPIVVKTLKIFCFILDPLQEKLKYFFGAA